MKIEIGKIELDIGTDLIESKLKSEALKYIQSSPLPGSTEKLEKYILKYLNKDIPLKNILIYIIDHIEVHKTKDEYAIILNQSPAEKLARMITFGTLDIRGTSILTDALKYACTQL